MKTYIAAAAAAALLLTGCEAVVGTVVDKSHEKGEWENKSRQECKTTTVNKKSSTSCKTVTDRVWDDADWVLVVEDKDGDEHEVEVSEKTYEQFEVGAHFDESKR